MRPSPASLDNGLVTEAADLVKSILALSSAGAGSGERLNSAHFSAFPFNVSFAIPCLSLFIYLFLS